VSGHFRLPGAAQLEPVRQGTLSKLCGMYSVINAIRLLLHPRQLSKPQLHDLYLTGIRYLSKKRLLQHVLETGMEEDIWLGLADALAEHVNQCMGMSILVRKILRGGALSSRLRALQVVRRTMRTGSPIIAGFGGTHHHYTVLAGYTDQSLLLCDSSGLRWLAWKRVGLEGVGERPHQLHADSVSVLVRDW
jgi:hypothetical protein